MKLLPNRHTIDDAQRSGQTLGRGMDFALVVLVFLGIGYALDGWLGTRPWCTVGLVVFGVVGQFVKMYYEYSATMEQLEQQRSTAAIAHQAPAHQAPARQVTSA